MTYPCLVPFLSRNALLWDWRDVSHKTNTLEQQCERAIAAEGNSDKEEFIFTDFERTELDLVLCALGKTFEGIGSSNIYSYGGEIYSLIMISVF